MVPQWVIEKKRDGQALPADDIRAFMDGYTRGTIPDYQMAALAMAIYFRGMTFDEVATLTDVMMRSGDLVDTSRVPLPKVDKHSTGGIGDKVSLVLAPLIACCDVAVPMISGRGLGITGGTLDKLESIPGYRTNLSADNFVDVLARCGCAIIGQTATLAPADKKLYALRDVTGTVPSIPLISASIMSKKLAEGTDALVLDVKWGQGAFMKSLDQARELARTMVEIGARMGKGMTALLTDMNQPLGRTAGNALEIVETVAALQGHGPDDLVTLTLETGAHMLRLTGREPDHARALARLRGVLDSGAAFERFLSMVTLQGGDPRVLEDVTRLPSASLRRDVSAPRSGYVAGVDAERIGRACVVLGAGRVKVEDLVDHAVGISGLVKIGEHVTKGQPLFTLHANAENRLAEALALAREAVTFADSAPTPPTLIVDVIHPAGGR
ncbi:MAG: thymidine phosphorylase [Lentisphaerae bacterium]|nr:thymidine phosphorylase [Lentisphaerota bacterium]